MLSHHQNDSNAGAAGADLHLAQALREAGNEVELLFYDDVLPSIIHGTWKQVLYPLLAGLIGFVKHLRNRYDVIDTTAGDGYWLYRLIRSFGLNKPFYSVRTHGLEHLRAELDLAKIKEEHRKINSVARLYHFRYRLSEVFRDLRLADSVFFLNDVDKKYAVERLNICESKIHVMPNAIPDHFFTATTGEQIASPFLLIFLGAWTANKGIDILTEIGHLAFLADTRFRLTCAGVRASTERVVSSFRKEFHDRISVVEEYHNRELPALLNHHGIMILPSMAEGSNLSILESLACGLPVITYRSADPAGIVVDQKNGMIMDNKSPSEVVQWISSLANNMERYVKLAGNARSSVRQCRWKDRADLRLKVWTGNTSSTHLTMQ